MPRRWVRALVVPAVLCLLSACSTPAWTMPATLAGTPSAPLPADQAAFRVTTAGGLLPFLLYALESPQLVVYGDGRVVHAIGTGPGQVPRRFEVGKADPMAVAVFVARAQAQGLVNPAVDFGRPTVTDQASTRVRLQGAGPAVEVGLYAFTDGFEQGLTSDQRRARQALRELIGLAGALDTGSPRTAFEPDRVTVYEIAAGASGGTSTPLPWPGPNPDSFLKATQGRTIACGHLTGQPAKAAYAAALVNPGARWLAGGKVRVLAVNPLPAIPDC